jgi:hypothetical protein
VSKPYFSSKFFFQKFTPKKYCYRKFLWLYEVLQVIFWRKDFYLLRTLHANFNPQKEVAHQYHGPTLTTFFKWTISSRLDKCCPNLPNSPSSGGVSGAILAWVPICLPRFVPWEMHFVALGKGENLEFLFFFLSFLVLTYLTTFVTTQLSPICPWGKTLEPRLLLGSLVVQKLWVKKTHLIRLVECEIMEIMVGLHPPTTKIVAKTPLTNFVSICVAPYLGWAWFYHRNIWVMWTLLGMNMVLSPQCLNNVKPYLGWAWFYCRNVWIMWNPTWDEHGSIAATFE